MPMFVDKLVAGDEMDEIAHRILDEGEDIASVAMDFIDESRYIISDHETFEAATFAVKKDTEGVTVTAEPDSEHPFSVSYNWQQIGMFLQEAAELARDVQREAEEAWARDIAENMEAYDALDHHRDVYLELPDENDAAYPISDARKPDLHNYRLHFETEQGYLLMADSDTEQDLMLRNFTMVNSQIVLHGVQEMGFTVTGLQPAATYEIYQMKGGEQYHYHRFESLESNKDAGLSVADYDLVYTGDWSGVTGDSVQQRLDSLFQRFNVDHPADFHGHSVSVSDVIVVTENGSKTAYYVDSAGFAEMPDFFMQKKESMQTAPDTILQIPEMDISVDIAAVKQFVMTDTFGYLDENSGALSEQSESYTYTYLGNGVVEEAYSSTMQNYPSSPLRYNLNDGEQRDRLLEGMLEYARKAEKLTLHSEPHAETVNYDREIERLKLNARAIGKLRDLIEEQFDTGIAQLRQSADSYVDELASKMFEGNDAFLQCYHGEAHDQIVDAVFDAAYERVAEMRENVHQLVWYSDDTGAETVENESAASSIISCRFSNILSSNSLFE